MIPANFKVESQQTSKNILNIQNRIFVLIITQKVFNHCVYTTTYRKIRHKTVFQVQNNLSHYQHAFVLWQISTKSIIINTEAIQISICGVPHPSFRQLLDIPDRTKKTKQNWELPTANKLPLFHEVSDHLEFLVDLRKHVKKKYQGENLQTWETVVLY